MSRARQLLTFKPTRISTDALTAGCGPPNTGRKSSRITVTWTDTARHTDAAAMHNEAKKCSKAGTTIVTSTVALTHRCQGRVTYTLTDSVRPTCTASHSRTDQGQPTVGDMHQHWSAESDEAANRPFCLL